MTNTLAYYDTALVAAVKGFVVQAAGVNIIYLGMGPKTRLNASERMPTVH